MKALAIDSAAECMVISAKNEFRKATLTLALGMKQSPKILPAIDYVLGEVELSPADLDYTALCSGPGTFTGLRLGFSALKAIELAHNVPIYGIKTLDAYAEAFSGLNTAVISVVDAKKNQFFASIHKNGNEILEAEDTTVQRIAEKLKDFKLSGEDIFVTGINHELFMQQLLEVDSSLKLKSIKNRIDVTDSLFRMAEKMISSGEAPLKDYDGPIYLRKSEAEIVLESKSR